MMEKIQIPFDDDIPSRHFVRRGRWAGSSTSPALIDVSQAARGASAGASRHRHP